MPRKALPFQVDVEADSVRPHQLHVSLLGDLDGRPEVVSALRQLAARIAQGIVTVVVVYAGEARLVPEGASRWAAFIDDLPASIQFVYNPSQLSMVMRDFDDAYLRRHRTHVHLDC